MNVQQLLSLNKSAKETWKKYDRFLKNCLANNTIKLGVELVDGLSDVGWMSICDSNYIFYAVVFYARDEQFEKALAKVKEAYQYGYRSFYYFDPEACKKGQADEKYEILKAAYTYQPLIDFVQSVYTGKREWGRDINKTPLSWLEKIILNRKNERCEISEIKLEKGQEVYRFCYFNVCGGGGFYYADIKEFDNHKKAAENKNKYDSNGYSLSEFAFDVGGHNNPWLNHFWYSVSKGQFDLRNTLHAIADPSANPTPYRLLNWDLIEQRESDRMIWEGDGGEFINILWVLIKCGYFEEIVALLPELPEHFPLSLMYFDDDKIRQTIAHYLEIPELVMIYDLVLKPKHSTKEIKQCIDFGMSHPKIQQLLAKSLNLYECHLYSNYHPGIDWYCQSFRQFSLAKGGGLLYLLISQIELIPALKIMKEQKLLAKGIGTGAYDAYDNTFIFHYRAIVFNHTIMQSKGLASWFILPEYIKNSGCYGQFNRLHKQTVKISVYLQKEHDV